MMGKSNGRTTSLLLGAFSIAALLSACTPRPSDRYTLTYGADLKPGHARMLILQEDTDRKGLAASLAQALQTCLIDKNASFSGMQIEGPRQLSPGVWQIALADLQERDNRGRDVLVTIGGPPARQGVLKALPKGVSLGKGAVTVKRVGAVNRTDSVLGVVADSIAGMSPCDGIPGTGISLVGQQRQVRAALSTPSVPQYPLPVFYPKFYR